MATSKKASRKSATKKKAAKGSKKRRHKGGHGGGGGGGGVPIDIDAQDPIIVTGGGSVSLEFDPGEFLGSSGKHHNINAHLKSVEIDGTSISVTRNSKITIWFDKI